MKKILLMFICLGLASQARAEDKLVTLLSTNVASFRDEMYQYKVTYSDVKIEKDTFQFTQTALAKDELGQVKFIVKFKIPVNLLKAAKHEVLAADGIGKNILVQIDLPETTPESAISTTTEIVGEAGKKTTETRGLELLQCDIYFSDVKTARAWSDELKRYLK